VTQPELPPGAAADQARPEHAVACSRPKRGCDTTDGLHNDRLPGHFVRHGPAVARREKLRSAEERE